jgi:site-specific recombinase XerD
MSKPSKFLALLNGFLNHYLPHSVGASPNTVTSYKYAFRLLIEFMYSQKGISADHVTFGKLDYKILLEFLDWLEGVRGCSTSTRNQRLAAILSFSKYAQNRDFEATSIFRSSAMKIPMKKSYKKPRAVFSIQEVSILLRLPNENKGTGLRDKILLSLMYASGARAQEMCDLTVSSVVFFSKGATLNIKGKGGKARRIKISDSCSQMLLKYINIRHLKNKPDRHIFSSQTHEQMTVSCIEGIFKKYVRLARIENTLLFRETNYSPHSMRHSTASHMLESGVSLVVIKNFLGHVSFQSTLIYAEMSQDTVDKYLMEWNKKWFPQDLSDNIKNHEESDIPKFLKI